MWIALAVAVIVIVLGMKIVAGVFRLIIGGIGLIIIIGLLIAIFNGDEASVPVGGGTASNVSTPAAAR